MVIMHVSVPGAPGFEFHQNNEEKLIMLIFLCINKVISFIINIQEVTQ